MKVAIDISPLKSAHQFRGVGSYTKRLVEALQLIKVPNFSFQLIEEGKIPDDCDIVHYPYFDLFFLTLPLRKSKPTVVTIHDVTPLVFPQHFPPGIKGKIKFQIQKLSLKGVKAVITDSKNSKKDIANWLAYPKEKIYVIPLAPGKEFKKLEIGNKQSLLLHNWKLEIKEKYRLPETFLLYVGDVNYNKNIPGLIRAFKQIHTSEVSPRLWRGPSTSEVGLVLVGKAFTDESLIETRKILQLIKALNLNNQIKILGWVSDKDLPMIYNLATVYCQPSFYEGFGLPVLEAMACGCPVVAANTSSLPEVCGKAAVMVNPYDINDIANGLEKVIRETKIRNTLKEKGLVWVKNFSWEKAANQTIKVYQNVYQENKHSLLLRNK